jgi:hypothetical protein
MKPLALLLATLAFALPASCGRFMRRGNDEPSYIQFVNRSLSQADVFAVDDAGRAIRIGTVFGGRTETLTIPPDVVQSAGTLNIVARLLASSATPRTGPISLSRGETLQVTLPPDTRSLVVLPVR